MNSSKLFFTLIFFCVTNLLTAQQDFDELNGPPGALFYDIKQNDAGLYLATTEAVTPYQTTTFRSSVDGNNWTEISQIDYPTYFHTIGNDKNLYYTKDSFIYRSTDTGQTWEQLGNGTPSPASNFNTKIRVSSTGTIFVVKNGIIHRSSDEGISWMEADIQLENSSSILQLIEDTDTGTLFFTSSSVSNELYRSTNDGLIWELVLNSKYADFASNGDLYSTQFGQIVRSSDLGDTWEPINSPFGSPQQIQITATDRLIVNYSDNTLFSDDFGTTWNDFSSPSDHVTLSRTFAIEDGSVFFQIYRGLYKTEDLYADRVYAAYGTAYTSVKKFAFHNDKVFASNNDGLWQTEDNGQSWDLIFNKPTSYSTLGNFPNQDHNSDNDFFLNHGSTLFRQLAGETTFTDITPSVDNSNFFAPPGIVVFVSAVDNVFCIVDDVLYISEDKGETWSSNENFDFEASRADIFQNEAGRIFITSYNILYYSDDEGASWIDIPKPFTLRSMINNQGNIIAIIGFQDYSYLSTDQGQTWEEIALPDPITTTHVSMTSTPEGHFYIADDDGIIRSVDNGETWTIFEIDEEVPFVNFDGSAMSFAPDGHMYISTYRSYRSAEPIGKVLYIQGVSAADDNINCVLDAEETTGLSGQLVKLSSGDEDIFFVTPADAEYTVAGELGEHSLTAITPNFLWEECVENFTLTEADYGDTIVANALLSPIIDCPYMTVDIAAPFLRRCFTNILSIRYKNEGTITATDAYLTVDLDEYLVLEESSVPVSSQTDNQLTFELGDLEISQSGQILLTVTVSCDAELGAIHCVEANVFPNEICGEHPLWSGAIIEAEAACEGEDVIFTLSNTGTGNMEEEGTYYILENDLTVETANYQLDANESIEISYTPTMGGLARIMTEDVPGYPFPGYPTAFGYACIDSPDGISFSNWNVGSNSEPFSDGFCIENIGSFDPNDKAAIPEGYGSTNQIEANTDLKYLIRFQNTGTDIAFTVTVRDTLDENLDLSSLRLGASSHNYDFSIEDERVLVFTFNNILLPDSTTNLLASNGFLQFSIKQNEDLPIGTSLNNQAAIYFDFNEPVITNTVSHLIGVDFVEVVSSVDDAEEKMEAVLSPHPLHSRSLLNLPESYSGKNNIKIYDSYGSLVKTWDFRSNTVYIERAHLTTGVYWVQVRSDKEEFVGFKMVIF